MSSEWLRSEPAANAGHRESTALMRLRRSTGIRVVASVVSAALVAVGLVGGAAVPAAAAPGGGAPISGINSTFAVELTDIDASDVALVWAQGRNVVTIDATVNGVNAGITPSQLYFYTVDTTSVAVWVDYSMDDPTATLSAYSVSIHGGSPIAGTTGTIGSSTAGVAAAFGAYSGGATIPYSFTYPEITGTEIVRLYPFAESTGEIVRYSASSPTYTCDGTLCVATGTLTVTLDGGTSYGDSLRMGFVVGVLNASSIFGVAASYAALTPTTLTLRTPDSGGDTGGGSSAPAATTTTTAPPVVVAPTTAAVTPVVFADPNAVTAAEIAALTPEQVATITPQQFGALDPAAFAGFTPAQVQTMTTAQVNAIRPARAAQLSVAAVSALSGDQLFALRPAAAAALTPEAIETLSATQMASLRPETFKLMDAERINKIRPDQVTSLNTAQIKAINEKRIQAFRVDSLGNLTLDQARDLRPKQLENMSDRQITVVAKAFGPDLRKGQQTVIRNQIGSNHL